MLIKNPSDIPSSEITPKDFYMGRREFIGALGLAIGFGDKLTVGSKLVTTDDALTPKEAVTTYGNEFGSDKREMAGNSKPFKPKPWSVTVDGLCAKPGTYALEDILKPHTLEERVYRMRCVEGWSMVIPWDGFPLGDLIKRFEPSAKAKFVAFTTVWRPQEMVGQRQRLPDLLPWPYQEGLRMDEAMHPLTILAAGRIRTARRCGSSCRGSTASRASSRSSRSGSSRNSRSARGTKPTRTTTASGRT